jgi:hypothetical protein
MTKIDTLSDGTYTAVVDRIEDGLATVFVEQEGEEITGITIKASTLPEIGRHADAVFTVRITDGEIVDWTYEPETTETRQSAAQDRFDRLSSRPPSDEETSE